MKKSIERYIIIDLNSIKMIKEVHNKSVAWVRNQNISAAKKFKSIKEANIYLKKNGLLNKRYSFAEVRHSVP